MIEYRAWQTIIVDWDAGQYAIVDPPADDEDWDRQVCAELEKGRDIHCFHHDVDDASGLVHWAEQHQLTQTDIPHIMAVS